MLCDKEYIYLYFHGGRKMSISWKTNHCREKWTEIWDSGHWHKHIWGTLDLVVFNDVWAHWLRLSQGHFLYFCTQVLHLHVMHMFSFFQVRRNILWIKHFVLQVVCSHDTSWSSRSMDLCCSYSVPFFKLACSCASCVIVYTCRVHGRLRSCLPSNINQG